MKSNNNIYYTVVIILLSITIYPLNLEKEKKSIPAKDNIFLLKNNHIDAQKTIKFDQKNLGNKKEFVSKSVFEAQLNFKRKHNQKIRT